MKIRLALAVGLCFVTTTWAQSPKPDPRTYQTIAHPQFPVLISIPMDWSAESRLIGRDTYQWILAPRHDGASGNSPSIEIDVRRRPEAPPAEEPGQPIVFDFAQDAAVGAVSANRGFAEVDRGDLRFTIRAEVYSDEDAALVREILKYIRVEAQDPNAPGSGGR